jgi:glycosyltransferase involved in cell wall biosynthesis
MKVLIGCLLFREYTGSEMYVFELSKNLIKLGWDVTVTSPNIGGPLTDLAKSLGIKVYKLSSRFQKEDYDIIHSQHQPITEALLNLFPTKKMICTIHSEINPVENPIIHPNIKKYIAVRPEIKKYMVENFPIPEEKISTIYNPINTDKYNTSNTGDDNYTLFVGTIDPVRRQTIMNLVDYTRSEGRELWLVGKNHSNYLINLLSNSHVKYFDSTYDVEPFVKNCKETAGILLGRTTIEGWLCGKPGWIYDVDGSGNIRGKILYQVPDDINKFDSKIVAKEINEEYNKILND